MKEYRYKAYGVTFETPFPCPLEKYTKGIPQIRITYGKTPDALTPVQNEGVLYQANESEFLFYLKGVGRYWVQSPKKIIIQPDEEASVKDLRVFLFSSVFGYLLQKRGFLTIHANAVRFHKKGILIAGPSGVGKSTLTKALIAGGARFMVDDIASISFDQSGIPYVAAGLPRLKLWKDALKKLALEPSGLEPVREGLEKYEYNQFPVIKTHAQVHLIIVLRTHNKPDIQVSRLTGAEKFNVLKSNTYRYQFLTSSKDTKNHFEMASRLAGAVEIYRITRPTGSFMLNELVEEVKKTVNTHGNER